MFVTCFGVHCFVSFLVLQSSVMGKRERARERESWLLLLFVFLVSYNCYCSVTLPRGAVGWSAVCDCDIYWPYSLDFK